VSGRALRDALGEEAEREAGEALVRIGNEDLYLFASTIRGERDIASLDCGERARDWLVRQYRDRALLRLEHDTFVPAWSYRDCSRYQGLDEAERASFDRLAAALAEESAQLWEDQGRRLLGFMRAATDMLPCAEDLGAIPDCVPGVLQELRILGLRIPRWARLWHEPGQPYVPPSEYPFLSVCAPSVHDTSTMRGWWREEDDLHPFWRAVGLSGNVPPDYDPDTARRVTDALLHTSSALCVFQAQDLFALVDGIVPPDPEAERVNVPGTMTERNWSYRMPIELDELARHRELRAVLSPMLENRRRRALAAGS